MSDLGPLFEAAEASRVFTDPGGYMVSFETVRARCATAILRRGGFLVAGKFEPPEEAVDLVIGVLVSHGLMPQPERREIPDGSTVSA